MGSGPGGLEQSAPGLDCGSTMDAIRSFKGEHDFLSNFYPCRVAVDGREAPTVEHAFQAAKTRVPEEQELVLAAPTPAGAKQRGRKVRLRPDWNTARLEVMEGLLRQKFAPGAELARRLLATGDALLEEGNTPRRPHEVPRLRLLAGEGLDLAREDRLTAAAVLKRVRAREGGVREEEAHLVALPLDHPEAHRSTSSVPPDSGQPPMIRNPARSRASRSASAATRCTSGPR